MDTRVDQVDTFVDLVCDDPELLRAEFDAIVAAEWPAPPDRPGRHDDGVHRQPAARTTRRRPGPRPAHRSPSRRTVRRSALQRSPPGHEGFDI